MSDTDEHETYKDRRRANTRFRDIGVLVALSMQAAGIIWAAATLKSGVDQTKVLVAELKTEIKDVVKDQRVLELANARHAGRVDALESMVVELRRRP